MTTALNSRTLEAIHKRTGGYIVGFTNIPCIDTPRHPECEVLVVWGDDDVPLGVVELHGQSLYKVSDKDFAGAVLGVMGWIPKGVTVKPRVPFRVTWRKRLSRLLGRGKL